MVQQINCSAGISLEYDNLAIANYNSWPSASDDSSSESSEKLDVPPFSGWVTEAAGWNMETLSFFKELKVETDSSVLHSKLTAALLDQGIKWTMALFPQCCDRLAFEYAVVVNIVVALCESRGSNITLQQVKSRAVKILGVDVDFALDYVLKPLATQQREKFKSEFYWALYLILGKQAEQPTAYYRAWCKELGSSYENYIRLRNIDGQFGLAVVFYGCLLERKSLKIDMKRLSAAVEANILIHDCTARNKHVAEKEICNVLNFAVEGHNAFSAFLVRAGNIYNALHSVPIIKHWEWMYAGSIQAMYMLNANNPRYTFIEDLCRSIGPRGAVPPPVEKSTWYEPSDAMVKDKLI